MIKIGGIIKHSTGDYPGRIASVVFIRGCDFRCPFCHNPELIYTEGDNISPLTVSSTLKEVKKWIDGVCITGGEPMLYPDVIDLINYLRKEIELPVKIDTNGNHPEILERIINENIVDYIAMDIKHIPGEQGYAKAVGRKILHDNIVSSINLLQKSTIEHQVRTTVVPGLHTPDDVRRIKELVGNSEYVLQNFRPGKTFSPEYSGLQPFSKKEFGEFEKIVLSQK